MREPQASGVGRGPAPQNAVEASSKLRPRRGVAAVPQGVDLPLQPSNGLLRGLRREDPLTGSPVDALDRRCTPRSRRAPLCIAGAGLDRVDPQPELRQPARHQRHAAYSLPLAPAQDHEVIGVGNDRTQPLARPRLAPVAE